MVGKSSTKQKTSEYKICQVVISAKKEKNWVRRHAVGMWGGDVVLERLFEEGLLAK